MVTITCMPYQVDRRLKVPSQVALLHGNSINGGAESETLERKWHVCGRVTCSQVERKAKKQLLRLSADTY